MEAALDSLRAISETDQAKNALSLMQVYFNNIVKDPENPKYRKIRISNPKFNSAIWQLEQARTLLLLSGFEQEGEFLVLPSSIKLDGTKLLLDEAFGVSSPNEAKQHVNSGPSHSNESGTVLKLASQKGESLFDQDVKADLTLLSYMQEMGYDVIAAEKALVATKNKGVQPAIDWINQNPYDKSVKPPASEVMPHGDTSQDTTQALCVGSSSDSGVHPAPVSRYHKTMAERHKFQEKVRLEAIEEAKLEKQRKKLQREYLLRDMKDEKLEKAKHAKLTENTTEPSTCATSDQAVDDRESALMVDLKIRLPDGEVLSLSLSSDSTIEKLYQEVRRLWSEDDKKEPSDFVLMTSFPQIRISDMESSLEAAGLSSRAALVVQRADQHGVVTQGEGAVVKIKNITSIDQWSEVLSLRGKLIVVQFYAKWCSSCKSVMDTYDSLNAKYGMNEQALFTRVNVDELRVLKYQQAVTTLPTFKLFWNGQAVTQVQGNEMASLEQQIAENLHGPNNDPQEESSRDDTYVDPR
ncbi:uncharacterized protein [Montipora foliosa]|uniref:uncharacterized protein n=1 Tax=Montipora foliosa TaxID=591990 RepID=UPI0035F12AD4